MQTNKSKSAIFDSIRRNLAVSLPFDKVHREHQASHSNVEILPDLFVDLTNTNLVETFQKNLVAVGGVCEIAANKTQAISLIEQIIEEKNAKRIAVSDAPLIGEIVKSLDAKIEILQNAAASDLFGCDLGITSAQFGIAETGTLVIESDKEFNRLTSLIPPVHICVLETSKMRETLGEVLSELEKNLSRSITFITGQSRTSDIELTLALGVHGPGELFVILIEE